MISVVQRIGVPMARPSLPQVIVDGARIRNLSISLAYEKQSEKSFYVNESMYAIDRECSRADWVC